MSTKSKTREEDESGQVLLGPGGQEDDLVAQTDRAPSRTIGAMSSAGLDQAVVLGRSRSPTNMAARNPR